MTNKQIKILMWLIGATAVPWFLAVIVSLISDKYKPVAMALWLLGSIGSIAVTSYMTYICFLTFENIFRNLMSSLSNPQPIRVSFEDMPTSFNHTHNHYHHGERKVTEGVEQVEVKPDGTTVTTRHVKKWD
jgi:ABC-type nickel/cobalt efflux system permease component RcnA